MVEGVLLAAVASLRDTMEKKAKPPGYICGYEFDSAAKQPKAKSYGSYKSTAEDGAQTSRALGLIPWLRSAHVSD